MPTDIQPSGYDAAVHAAGSDVTAISQDHVFVKLDFYSAFKRGRMLQSAYTVILKVYSFLHQYHSFTIVTPIGPFLFCLSLQPMLHSLQSVCRMCYPDDLSLNRSPEIASLASLKTSFGAESEYE